MKTGRPLSVTSIVILSVMLVAGLANAGTRYRDIVFSSVKSTTDIQFGSSMDIDSTMAPLFLDFYEPSGDTLKARPLVICIHGGSLVSGARTDMTSNCVDFAKRGYVAATIDYRLGIESPKGVRTILEALLRGVQDTKAAVRFFRKNAAKYGIDTSNIYLEGSSAGSMIAVHYAYWNENEIPADVDQAKWGDIEGASGNPGYSSAIKGIVNYCGGIVDPAWINAGEPPVASIDGLADTIVPQDSGVSGDFGIMLYGGIAISRIATPLGIYNQGVYFPGQGHGGGADSVQGFGSNFLYSLMVLASSSPQDFSSMRLSANSMRIFRYDNYQFTASALDKSGNTIILPQSMIQYSCDSRIGSIEPYGLFTPADKPDSGYVYANVASMVDSCFVVTYDFKYFVVTPRLTVVDTLRTLRMNVNVYSADSALQSLPNTAFKWTSTNPSVGTIDSTGLFTPKMNGTTDIVAALNGYSDTSVVRVESASGTVTFASLDSLTGWTFDGENLDSLSVSLATNQKSQGNASFRINYKYTYTPGKTYMIYLNKDLPVYGIPDSIFLDVKSNGLNHRLYYRFEDEESNLFRAIGRKYLNDSTAFAEIPSSMTGLSPLSGVTDVVYPLTFKRIEIQLTGSTASGATNSGTIYVDNMKLKYPGVATGVKEPPVVPALFTLEQNYPNPFNPTTTIGYRLPAVSIVSLRVYDVLGREVATLVNQTQNPGYHRVTFDAGNLASGVYFYRLSSRPVSGKAPTYGVTKKLVLLK